MIPRKRYDWLLAFDRRLFGDDSAEKPRSNFQMIEDAGHAAFEPGIARALVAASERFKGTGALSL